MAKVQFWTKFHIDTPSSGGTSDDDDESSMKLAVKKEEFELSSEEEELMCKSVAASLVKLQVKFPDIIWMSPNKSGSYGIYKYVCKLKTAGVTVSGKGMTKKDAVMDGLKSLAFYLPDLGPRSLDFNENSERKSPLEAPSDSYNPMEVRSSNGFNSSFDENDASFVKKSIAVNSLYYSDDSLEAGDSFQKDNEIEELEFRNDFILPDKKEFQDRMIDMDLLTSPSARSSPIPSNNESVYSSSLVTSTTSSVEMGNNAAQNFEEEPKRDVERSDSVEKTFVKSRVASFELLNTQNYETKLDNDTFVVDSGAERECEAESPVPNEEVDPVPVNSNLLTPIYEEEDSLCDEELKNSCPIAFSSPLPLLSKSQEPMAVFPEITEPAVIGCGESEAFIDTCTVTARFNELGVESVASKEVCEPDDEFNKENDGEVAESDADNEDAAINISQLNPINSIQASPDSESTYVVAPGDVYVELSKCDVEGVPTESEDQKLAKTSEVPAVPGRPEEDEGGRVEEISAVLDAMSEDTGLSPNPVDKDTGECVLVPEYETETSPSNMISPNTVEEVHSKPSERIGAEKDITSMKDEAKLEEPVNKQEEFEEFIKPKKLKNWKGGQSAQAQIQGSQSHRRRFEKGDN